MFEDSLFASKGEGRSLRSRGAAVSAIVVQGALVAGLLMTPMLRPLGMPILKTAPAAVSLSVRRPEVKPVPVRVRAAVNETGLHAPSAALAPIVSSHQRGQIAIASTAGDALPTVAMGGGMGTSMGSGLGVGSGVGEVVAPVVRVAARGGAALRISSGVSSGLLLTPMRPVYPAIARAARVEGTVVVTAKIDKSGRIVGLQVVSGPEMLRSAAVEAISNARYRPYMLNGEATEVETTIAVNFRMGG